jgi:hypothetical protein
MDEDRWDPLKDVLPSPEADDLGTDDLIVPPGQRAQPATPGSDQLDLTGGEVLPNDAQELGTDQVEESDIESFPASDAPAW